jgi:hypothetical protein
MKAVKYKPTVNKLNGQINICLKKKSLPKSFLRNIDKLKSVTMRIEKWEED